MITSNTELSIDGVVPGEVRAPQTAEDAARMLSDAHEAGQSVAPVGGATSLALGNVPERVDVALSTHNLTGVLAYEPTDMTLSVMAGMSFADVQALLAEKGQTLPVDVLRPEQATIGGLIATGVFGPRRTGSPTFRDLLIGIATAQPSGVVTKAGGMVVKNVSGFDLMRLYLGSIGTLGLVVSANFKVLPLARSEATVLAHFEGLDAALAAAARVRESRVRPTSLEVLADNESWRTAVRVEGRGSTVRLLAAETAHLLHGDAETIEEDESSAWWQRYTDAQAIESGPADALLRASVRPRSIAETASSVWHLLRQAEISPEVYAVSPGVGQIACRLAAPDTADEAASFAGLYARLSGAVEHLSVLAAPRSWKREIDVWGGAPETIDVMRALKEEFDPGRVLNRGRFAGRI